jgi:lysozyme family protein
VTCPDFLTDDKLVLTFDGFKDDRAPGETFATAYGVTEMTWTWAIGQGVVEDKPIDQATAEDCETVRKVLFWNSAHCGQLPAPVALMVYNDSVLCGVGHAVRLLQRVCGVADDGDVGPATLGAVGSIDRMVLVDRLVAADDTYLAALAKAPLYLKGWERREDYMAQHAKAMV